MKVIVKLLKPNNETDVIARTHADFEKLEGTICIESRGIKEFYKKEYLKEQGYEYIMVVLDDVEIINECLWFEI